MVSCLCNLKQPDCCSRQSTRQSAQTQHRTVINRFIAHVGCLYCTCFCHSWHVQFKFNLSHISCSAPWMLYCLDIWQPVDWGIHFSLYFYIYLVLFGNVRTDTNEDRWIMGDSYSHFCNLSALAHCHLLRVAPAPRPSANGVAVLWKRMEYSHY